MSGGGGGGWGLDGVRTSGSARVGAGSTCINLSEERYKHREQLIGPSNGSQAKTTSLSKLINTLGLCCACPYSIMHL